MFGCFAGPSYNCIFQPAVVVQNGTLKPVPVSTAYESLEQVTELINYFMFIMKTILGKT